MKRIRYYFFIILCAVIVAVSIPHIGNASVNLGLTRLVITHSDFIAVAKCSEREPNMYVLSNQINLIGTDCTPSFWQKRMTIRTQVKVRFAKPLLES